MSRVNKSYYYLLPLIKEWSADADYPINSYAKNKFKDSLVLEYHKDDKPHVGRKIGEKGYSQFIKCDIDPKFKDDYKLILDGEYSRIHENTKASIINRAGTVQDSIRTEKILYKSRKLKKFLEELLNIDDIDRLSDEYDSKMFAEENFNLIEYDETRTDHAEPESVEV